MDIIDNSNVEQPAKKKFTGILVVLAVLILLGAGLFYVVSSGMFAKNRLLPPATPPVSGGGAEILRPNYSYKVKSISPDMIVLEGEEGETLLPNNPAKVTVYNGPTRDSPKMELSQLKVGDNANAEFVPGESATLFVSQI